MKRPILAFSFILSILNSAVAQQAQTGDTTRAHLSWHSDRYHNPNVVSAYLGYIDSSAATVQEVLDNMPLGMRTSHPNYMVDSVIMGIKAPNTDYFEDYASGNKLPKKNHDAWYWTISQGKTLYFSVRIRKVGTNHTSWTKAIKIKVI